MIAYLDFKAERVLRKLVKSYEGANKGQMKDSGLVSINARNRYLPNLDDRLLTAKITLATVLKTNKSLVEARQLFEDVLLTKKKRNETCDALTLRIVDALAEVHEALGCDAEAERCYISNFQLRVRLYGEGHIATIVSLLAVANLCAKQKNFGRASECFHQAKGLLESHLGVDDVKTRQAAKKAKKCLVEANRSIEVQSFDEARAHIMINVAGAGAGRQFVKSSRCEECNFQYTLLTREHHCR